jgi:subtilase family serine protease
MRKLSLLLAGTMILLAASAGLAQSPDLHHIYAKTPVRVSNIPQTPNNPTGTLPAQFKSAYGFNRIPNLGAGQTIALVDAYDDPNIASDVAAYASYFHYTPCHFQKAIVGSPLQGQGWDLEESLDVEQACALAPQANIVLVEANSNSFSDLLAAVQVAYTQYHATVVSMSWGGGEFSGEQQSDSYFCNITNEDGNPVTFFASTGDGGHGTEYPSVSPCVIAVGGTVLALASSNTPASPTQLNYGSEQAWRDGSGGVSSEEAQSSWQNPACSTWSTTFRCVPDVASDAVDVPVYDTYSYNGWVAVDGTSISSPDWASFATLVNSARVTAGKPTLSQAAQDLYTIYYSGSYSTDFHDIISGNNGSCGSQCNAAPGYDLTTGIGTYQANILFPALVADPN